MYYQIAKIFNCTNLSVKAFSYIERFFTAVCDTYNFLELDFSQVQKIISSSELNIDAEVEVLIAAVNWVKCDKKERKKFAKDLFSKIRYFLIKDYELEHIMKTYLFFHNIDELVILLKCISQKRKSTINKSFSNNRFCSQKSFNIIVTRGHSTLEVDCNNFMAANNLAQIKTNQPRHKSVYCKGNVYVFGDFDQKKNSAGSVQKYCMITNTWEHVTNIPDHKKFLDFSICAFTDQIYLIGGSYEDITQEYFFFSCVKFNTAESKWYDVAAPEVKRLHSACAVYQGRIVVSGGRSGTNVFDAVEAYDHVGDEWEKMPSMVERRYLHSLVAIRNKLFAVGNLYRNRIFTCEVYNSASDCFVLLKQVPSALKPLSNIPRGTIFVGSKLYMIFHLSPTVLCYDVDSDKWCEKPFEMTYSMPGFSCCRVPQIQI